MRRLRRMAQTRYILKRVENGEIDLSQYGEDLPCSPAEIRYLLKRLRRDSRAETMVCESAEATYEDVQSEGFRGIFTDFFDWLLANLPAIIKMIMAIFAPVPIPMTMGTTAAPTAAPSNESEDSEEEVVSRQELEDGGEVQVVVKRLRKKKPKKR